jgi:hypothetical protein
VSVAPREFTPHSWPNHDTTRSMPTATSRIAFQVVFGYLSAFGPRLPTKEVDGRFRPSIAFGDNGNG